MKQSVAIVLAGLVLGGCGEVTVSCDPRAPLAPDLALPLLDGTRTASLSEYRGKVVYLDFWGSWCLPCRDSLPFVNGVRNSLPRQEFEVLAVNLDPLAADARDFLERYPVDFPVLADPSQMSSERFGVEVLPVSFLIAADGSVCLKHVGFKESDKREIEGQIRALVERRVSRLSEEPASGLPAG